MVVSLVAGRGGTPPGEHSPPRAKPSLPRNAPQSPRPPPQPTETPPRYVDIEPPADPARLNLDAAQDPVVQSVTADSLAGGRTCRIGAWLQTALEADPEVRAALKSMPRATRSVANAVMLWDSRWVAQPPSAVGGISVIRAAMMAGIRAAPIACRAEVVRGPEILVLVDPSGSTVLAVGSGEWRWDDLLADSPPPQVLQTALAP